MTRVSTITLLFRLCYPSLMWKAGPNCAGEKNVLLRYGNELMTLSILKEERHSETFNILYYLANTNILLDCNSDHVTYLFECKQCQYHFPYVGCTKPKFWYRINNYKSTNTAVCRQWWNQKCRTSMMPKPGKSINIYAAPCFIWKNK